MSKFLIRRVRAIEHIHAVRPSDPATLCPVAWTARFEAHRPEHAALLATIRQRATSRTAKHLGHLAVALCADAGFDAWDGTNITMPPAPSQDELQAYALLDRLLLAVREYVSAAGDRFPLDIYGLG